MNKLDFGRNLHVEEFENEEWTRMVEGIKIFKGFNKKELFLLCMALGYKSNTKKKISKRYPTINSINLNEKQKYLLLSFGFQEIGDEALSEMTKVRSSAEEYAKAGFIILKKIIDDSDDELIHANAIIKKIKDLSKR